MSTLPPLQLAACNCSSVEYILQSLLASWLSDTTQFCYIYFCKYFGFFRNITGMGALTPLQVVACNNSSLEYIFQSLLASGLSATSQFCYISFQDWYCIGKICQALRDPRILRRHQLTAGQIVYTVHVLPYPTVLQKTLVSDHRLLAYPSLTQCFAETDTRVASFFSCSRRIFQLKFQHST